MADAEHVLEVMEREECLALLSAASIGRLGIPIPDEGPMIVPVNFVLDGDVVVFRSDEGTKLSHLRHPVSFEIDGIDPVHETGWSVLVKGFAYEATNWEVQDVELHPWAAGLKDHWVRIVPTTITGRRIRLLNATVDGRGYL
jgi:nitroimidazol reductase NimA-like FMN-containing flavoprotein (pyridoxamine 5'-phosphate oxidase superfamily)